MKPRHGRMLADPGQFRRDRGHRPAPHRRCGREPGCHPRFQRRFCHTDLAAFGSTKAVSETAAASRASGAIARHDFLLARLADRPCESQRRGSAHDRAAPRTPRLARGRYRQSRDEADQLFALGPSCSPADIRRRRSNPSFPRIAASSTVTVLLRPGRIPFLKLPEIGADRSVFAQIGPVGRDVHGVASHRDGSRRTDAPATVTVGWRGAFPTFLRPPRAIGPATGARRPKAPPTPPP